MQSKLLYHAGGSENTRLGPNTEFEANEPIKKLAKKLKKDGVIEHLYFKEQIFMLVRFANNDCLYLDPTSRKCKIYNL
jgi:Fe-S-cluster containining protein